MRTTSLLTPSSTVSASRSPCPGRLLSTPPPGSAIRLLGPGGGNTPAAASRATGKTSAAALGGGSAALAAPASVRGDAPTVHRATPTPATVAAASVPRNRRRFSPDTVPQGSDHRRPFALLRATDHLRVSPLAVRRWTRLTPEPPSRLVRLRPLLCRTGPRLRR